MRALQKFFSTAMLIFLLAVSGCASINNAGMDAISEVPKKPELAAQPLSAVTKTFVATSDKEFSFSENEVRYFQRNGVIARETDMDNRSIVGAGLQGAIGVLGGVASLDPVMALNALGGLSNYSVSAARIEKQYLVVTKEHADRIEGLIAQSAANFFAPREIEGRKVEMIKDTNYSDGYIYTYVYTDSKRNCEKCARYVVSKLPKGDRFIISGFEQTALIMNKYKNEHKEDVGLSYWPGLRWNGKVCVNQNAIIEGKELAIPDFEGMCISEADFAARQADPNSSAVKMTPEAQARMAAEYNRK